MTPERYQQIKAIVQEALDLGPAERTAFLGKACAGDPELRAEADSLLAHDVSASDFLETPAAAQPHQALNPGDQLGPYEIVAPLGSGGMGEVYRALDPRLGREVAIKVLPAVFAGDQDRLRRFELEARAASAVSHSNILVVHDIGMHHGSPFIVSELLEGTTLRTRLDAGALPERDAIQIAIGIAHGLAAAHQKGIVHRDLKPENLFVTGKNVVKILDFGLAKLVPRQLMEDADTASVSEDGTASGMVLGSVGYMSPEQVRGQPSDTRSDIFAFGAVLFEMLAGRRAFREGSKIETLHAILTRDPVAAETRQEISEPVKRIVSRCLNKDPDQRFQSAQDLAFHLEELSVPSPPTQAVAGLQTPKPKPVARIASAGWFPLVALLVVAVAVAIAGYVFWPRAMPPAPAWLASEVTLAVLPFDILHDDSAQVHIVDGIRSNLIGNLSKYEKLRIIDLATRNVPGRDAAIRAMLAGDRFAKITLRCTIMRLGEQTSVNATLFDSKTNSSIWSQKFLEGNSGILALVLSLTDAIAGQLGVAGTRKETGQNLQFNKEALDLYFRGREAMKWRTEKDLVEAIRHFQNAIKVDPRYALAYSGLADAYSLLGGIGIDGLPPERARSAATEAGRKALEHDSTLPQAYISRAYVKLSYDWDLPGAKEDFEQGIELEPKSATAHHWFSHYYMAVGDLDKAMAEMKRARELEPLSPSINNGLGWCFYYMRQYDKAIEQFQYALKLDPSFAMTHQTLGMAYQQKNRMEDAIKSFAEAERLSPDSPAPIAALACAYAAAGRTGDARQELKRLEMMKRFRYVPALYFLSIYLAFNDMKKVIAFGNQAIDERTDYLIYLGVEPRADSFRDSPELRKLQTLIKR